MSKLNTMFNGASAHYNRRTAQAAAAANVATRRRELRERGLISHRSTDAEIAAVEHRLTLQMRARDALAETGTVRKPHARLVALAGLAALVAAVIARRAEVGGGAVFLAFVATAAVVLAVGVPIMRRSEQRRADLVARADWDDNGACRWCGSHRDDTAAHLVDDEPEHPLVAHAVEVDAAIRG